MTNLIDFELKNKREVVRFSPRKGETRTSNASGNPSLVTNSPIKSFFSQMLGSSTITPSKESPNSGEVNQIVTIGPV